MCSPPTSAQPAGSADLDGAVNADQTCHIETTTATYSLDVSYPLDHPDQQALTDFITQDRDGFEDFVAALLPRDLPYEHLLHPHTYRSGTADSGTDGVGFEIHGNSDAHPVTSFHSLSYDDGTHAPITFDTLFEPGADPVAVLDSIVQREMDEQWQGMWLAEVAGAKRVSVLRSELASVLT